MSGDGVDLSQVIEGLKNPALKENVGGIMSMLKEVNTALKEIKPIIDFMGLEKEDIRRLAYGYFKLSQVQLPPATRSQGCIVPATKTHEQVFQYLNTVSEDDLKKQAAAQQDGKS